MKKVSTAATKQSRNISQPTLRPDGVEVTEIVSFRSVLGTKLIEEIIRH